MNEKWKNYTKDVELSIGDRILVEHNANVLYVGVVIHAEKDGVRCIFSDGKEYTFGSLEKWPILMYEKNNAVHRKELLRVLLYGVDQDYSILFPEREFMLVVPENDKG